MGICNSKKVSRANLTWTPPSWLSSNYDIESRPIGMGHYGRVYKATSKDGETVAIKIIRKRNLSFKELVSSANESKTLKKLNHSGILRLIDHHENQSHFVVVTEFVEGKTLTSVAQQRGHKFTEA